MSRIFTPVRYEELTENICGPDHIGIQTTVKLIPGSLWKCTKSGRYFVLNKNGASAVIRCTDTALMKHFVEVK